MMDGLWKFNRRAPFISFFFVFAAGLCAGKYLLHFPYSLVFTFIFLVSAPLLLCVKKAHSYAHGYCLMLLFTAAVLRYHLAAGVFSETHLANTDVQPPSPLVGMITEALPRQDGTARYMVSDIPDSSTGWQGTIMVSTRDIKKHFSYGDIIEIRQKILPVKRTANPGQFDYAAYLQRKGIFHSVYITDPDSIRHTGENRGNFFQQEILNRFRDHCNRVIARYTENQAAFLMRAMILGEKQDLSRQLVRSFQTVGVVHILAISGLHVGFIVAFVYGFLSLLRLPGELKVISLIIVLLLYCAAVNFKPPVLRASIMTILYAAGGYSQRKINVYNIIFAAAFFILLLNPVDLFNAGFQFSFAAVFTIIYGYQRLSEILPRVADLRRMPAGDMFVRCIWTPLLISFAATAGTMPLTVYYYGMMPLYAVAANLLVIPLAGLLVSLTIFLLILGSLIPWIAAGLGLIISLIYKALTWVVSCFASLPFASVELSKPPLWQVAIAMVLILLLFKLGRKPVRHIFLVILATAVLTYGLSDALRLPQLHVTFLDVGQGDAAVVRFPNRRIMLVDAGNAYKKYDNGTATVLPFLKQQGSLHIQYAVASHPHDDHIAGFKSLFERITVDTFVTNAYPYTSQSYEELLKICRRRNITIRIVSRGDRLYPDPACRVYVLHPDSASVRAANFSGAECNNSSIVLKIAYRKNSVLCVGDLEHEGEALVESYDGFLRSDILKVGHHGSKTSSSASFLNTLKPFLCVVSVAQRNKFKHPSPRTVGRIRALGSRLYLTSHHGAVQFSLDGGSIKKIE